MKKSLTHLILLAFLFACAPTVPASTITPAAIITPIPTSTPYPTTPPTPTPVWVTLGSPFASDCGDGIPIIRANSTFNGIDKDQCIDSFHGHTDFWVPAGCEIDNYDGEVIAPASGSLSKYKFGDGEGEYGYTLFLPKNTLVVGIENAFRFSGILDFDIKKVESIRLELGHIDVIEGEVQKGQTIGNVFSINPSGRRILYMMAYWVGIIYNGEGYSFSPTLFLEDPNSWQCVNGITLPNECEPIPNNYPENCK